MKLTKKYLLKLILEESEKVLRESSREEPQLTNDMVAKIEMALFNKLKKEKDQHET